MLKYCPNGECANFQMEVETERKFCPMCAWKYAAVKKQSEAHNEMQAILHMQEGACGILILCHTLRESTSQGLMQKYRKYCPGNSNVPWQSAKDLDAMVYGVEGPEALIAAIRGDEAA
jgi:hypothetical protein